MIKTKYMKWQEKTLRETPLRPYELTADGLALLRRNILLSIVSLAATAALISVAVSKFRDQFIFQEQLSPGFQLILTAAIFLGLIAGGRVLDKSTGYLMETGLWWRLSVSDNLQDEWERGQKHLSGSRSYEWLVAGLAGLFVVWIIATIISYLVNGAAIPMPSLYVSVPLAIVVLWGVSLMPLVHTAWTLDPILDDEASPEDMTPHIVNADVPEETPKPKKSWGKRLLDMSPYIVGLLFGIYWASRGEGGVFYNFGHDIGQWFGQFF